MITGNETGKKVYAHTARLAADLTRMGWDLAGTFLLERNADLEIKVAKSCLQDGAWSYWTWVPVTPEQKVLLKLGQMDLFYSALDAALDQVYRARRCELYRYAKTYRVHNKTGWAGKILGFLAKRHQAGTPCTLSGRPENFIRDGRI